MPKTLSATFCNQSKTIRMFIWYRRTVPVFETAPPPVSDARSLRGRPESHPLSAFPHARDRFPDPGQLRRVREFQSAAETNYISPSKLSLWSSPELRGSWTGFSSLSL